MDNTVLSVLTGSAIAAVCMLALAMMGRMEVDERYKGPDEGALAAEEPVTYQAAKKRGKDEQLKSVSYIWKLGLPIGCILGGVIGLMANLSSRDPAVGNALKGGLAFVGIGICLAVVIAVRYSKDWGQMTPSLAFFMFFVLLVLPAFMCGMIVNGLFHIISFGGPTDPSVFMPPL